MHKPVLAAFSRCLSNNGVGRFADLVDVRLSGMNGFRIVSLEVCRCSSNGGDRSGHPDHGIQVGEIEFLWVKFVETLRQVILGFDNLLSGGRVSKMVAFVKTDAPNIIDVCAVILAVPSAGSMVPSTISVDPPPKSTTATRIGRSQDDVSSAEAAPAKVSCASV